MIFDPRTDTGREPVAARPPHIVLRHVDTEREIPVEGPTVFGRSDDFYRYRTGDDRHDRLERSEVEQLARLNYVHLCDDGAVSRTHGVVDPQLCTVTDLNSTNGTFLNGQTIGTGPETRALIPLGDGDEIAVGRSTFRVHLRAESFGEACARVGERRRAVVAFDEAHRSRARPLQKLLLARKSFSEVKEAWSWTALSDELRHLRRTAHEDGVVLIAIHARSDGVGLVLDDAYVPLADLVRATSYIPGRVVLVLDIDEDPAPLGRLFASLAFEDEVLIASAGVVDLVEPLFSTVSSELLDAARDSVCGESGHGILDGAVDGVDALIPADTNVLDVSWIDGYLGRLEVVVGTRPRPAETDVVHSIRLGSTRFRV